MELSDEELFTRLTGLEIKDPIEVELRGNDYMAAEGEEWLIFTTTPEQIARWIEQGRAPYLSEWDTGMVPHQIGFHCSFGLNTPGVSSVGGEESYSGDEDIISILSDPGNLYASEERCCGDDEGPLRYHNGTLLIIKPDSNKVYLSVWDY